MSRITDYTALTSPETDDVLVIVDVHDDTQSAEGTTKQITLANLPFDASGAASTAQSNAESFATSAVATETSRAETAEALLAPKASPALTGTPTAPTASALTDSTQVATTAYADSAVAVETSRAETAEALKAPLASPALTGSPTAPTQTTGDSSTKIATDAFVATAVATETTRAETAEALKAALASPALTGTPTAPTATALTDSTQIATTAYADSAVATETSRAETAEALKLAKASNLSDVASAAAAYNNISPMTTKGDIEYESAAGTASRLAIGSVNEVLGIASGVPAWQLAMTLQGTSALAGYALINGTGNILTWTAPNDGNIHMVFVIATLHVTSNATGGAISFDLTIPDGTAENATAFFANNLTAGVSSNSAQRLIEPNTTVTLAQAAALTGGAAVLWAQLWCC